MKAKLNFYIWKLTSHFKNQKEIFRMEEVNKTKRQELKAAASQKWETWGGKTVGEK